MSRIGEITLAGKKYPLNFSVKAAKEVSARYGGLDNVDAAFSEKSIDEMMDEAIFLLSILIEQGVLYKRIAEGEEIKGIAPDELEVVLGVSDLAGVKAQILGAMIGGMSREVEVEPEKNVKTTQGN
jgi:hypothetical protein